MWMVLISICGFFTLVMSLAFCLCWKKQRSHPELTGIDGLVISKNPDENVNHLPSAGLYVVDGPQNDPELSKRSTLPTNTRRSLPDIPFDPENVNWVPTVDNSSEHYASVEQYQNSIKRHTLPNGIETRRSISQHSSLSQADFSPYEKVKYDKIKSKEHPYAQLQPINNRSSAVVNNDIPEEPGTSQRSETGESSPTARDGNDHNSDIPAASAVSGVIAANPELPYMTPPVPQTNFSGDSQDSTRYTSISVREPLANILAHTKDVVKKRELDPHYSTVSDDSDDVYTTIPDPNQVYTSESETYARIPPGPIVVEAEINQAAPRYDSDENNDEIYQSGGQPAIPSVDTLKHGAQGVTHTHSRQASSSSSTINVGSPKPEKRQANSPLPPPPNITNTEGDKKLPLPRNIDDLYAKVQKNKMKGSPDEEKVTDSSESTSTLQTEESGTQYLRKKYHEHNYETLRKPHSGEVAAKPEEPGYASINGPDSLCNSDPGYEVLKVDSDADPNYEELKHKSSNASDAGYSKIRENLFGYSVVNKKKKMNTSPNSSTQDSNTLSDSLDEPNYESMPSDFQYAGLKSSGSETDPNYESVKYLDEPPYEKVDDGLGRTNSEIVGYETVDTRGYENIDTSESSDGATNGVSRKRQNQYEKLGNDDDVDSLRYSKIEDLNLKTKTSSLESSSSNKSEDRVRGDVVNDTSANILDENAIFEV